VPAQSSGHVEFAGHRLKHSNLCDRPDYAMSSSPRRIVIDDPLLDTPEFRRLLQNAESHDSGGVGVNAAAILEYAESMMANYPDDAARLLGTCRLLAGVLAVEIRET